MNDSIVFDRAVNFYDETRGFPLGEDVKIAALIAQLAGLTRDSRVLEIGVGTGRIALPLAAHTGTYVGVDLSRPMMQKLRAKSGQRIELVEGDVTRLPLASTRFDAAVIVHVFHLVSDPTAAAHELARVLRPDSGKAIHCWNRYDTAFQPLYEAWEKATSHKLFSLHERNKSRNILDDLRWRPLGETHIYHFHSHRTPAEMVDLYRRRVWSSLWDIPDDVWREGIKQVEAALQQHYPDPHAPVTIPAEFHIRIYNPPQ
jgi:ubiquinone/menaquinone biosynthesis C-methylase UbiE